MGVLNVTPDSFSDGGHHHLPAAALARTQEMIAEGVDVIDVGGESTRPGAIPVDSAEEIRRVRPVIAAMSAAGITVSVDTIHAATAREAMQAGANEYIMKPFTEDIVREKLHETGVI